MKACHMLAVFPILAPLVACRDSTGLAPLDGAYALRRVEETAGPPFILSDLSCEPDQRTILEITGDTITLGPANTARRSLAVSSRHIEAGFERPPLLSYSLLTGSYVRVGDAVIVRYPDVTTGALTLADTLQVTGSTLRRDRRIGGTCSSGPTDMRRATFEYDRL